MKECEYKVLKRLYNQYEYEQRQIKKDNENYNLIYSIIQHYRLGLYR